MYNMSSIQDTYYTLQYYEVYLMGKRIMYDIAYKIMKSKII